MIETIVVFGATGSVGVYTTLHLKKTGYDVVAVGHRKSDNGFFAKYGIPYYSVDISNKECFNILPRRVDQILHFAGAMPARMSGYDPYQYIDSILLGTLNILEYGRMLKISKIVFTQSISDILYLFGTINPILPNVERKNPLIGDHSVYSISKNAAVDLIEHYYFQYGIKRFILRLPTIYLYHPNPYYYVEGQKKWMGYRLLIDKAIKGEDIEIWGNPKSEKEIVYVKDFVQIVEGCVKSDLDGGIYNVGTGVGVSIEEQIYEIIDVFSEPNNRSKVKYCPEKPSSPQFRLDISNTIKDLAYNPQFSYINYLYDFKKEMKNNPFKLLWGCSKDYE